jgi:hypothetical protein
VKRFEKKINKNWADNFRDLERKKLLKEQINRPFKKKS